MCRYNLLHIITTFVLPAIGSLLVDSAPLNQSLITFIQGGQGRPGGEDVIIIPLHQVKVQKKIEYDNNVKRAQHSWCVSSGSLVVAGIHW